MGYIETEHGEIWDNPPPAPTHKTKALNEIEFTSLFSEPETIRILNLKAYITNPAYDVVGDLV